MSWIPRPLPLQNLLSPSLLVPIGCRSYADVITKFSRIDWFPFSSAMKVSPSALRARRLRYEREVFMGQFTMTSQRRTTVNPIQIGREYLIKRVE